MADEFNLFLLLSNRLSRASADGFRNLVGERIIIGRLNHGHHFTFDFLDLKNLRANAFAGAATDAGFVVNDWLHNVMLMI